MLMTAKDWQDVASLTHQLLEPAPALATARVSTDTEEIDYEHKNNALANGTLGSVKNVI